MVNNDSANVMMDIITSLVHSFYHGMGVWYHNVLWHCGTTSYILYPIYTDHRTYHIVKPYIIPYDVFLVYFRIVSTAIRCAWICLCRGRQ